MSDTVIHPKTAAATRTGLERLVELWPDLPPQIREELVAIAEAEVAPDDTKTEFILTPEEMASVEAAREDFKHGRTMTLEELEASIRLKLAKFA